MKRQLVQKIGRYTIHVTVDSCGVFWAEWEGESYRSETFKGLRAKLLPKVREDAKRCELPAMLRSYGGEWEDILLIGIHADNGNVLYTDATRKTHQCSRNDKRIYRPLSQAERREYSAIEARIERERKVLNGWLKKRLMNPGKAVRIAIGLPGTQVSGDESIDDDDDLE